MDKNHPLRIERQRLDRDASDAYSPEHFPGTAAWFACQAAKRALRDFDNANPEVHAAIKAERAANPPSYMTDPNSHYNRALRGED